MPVFVLDDALLHGRHASGSRTQFMLECLTELRGALQQRGGNLVIARGKPERELTSWPANTAPRRSTSPPTRRRSRWPATSGSNRRSKSAGIEPRRTPGNFVADIGKPKPYAVFTPFWRAGSSSRAAT